MDEKERKILENTNLENRSIIYDTAIQKADTLAGALVAEVFGMFVIFSLVQPLVPWPTSLVILVKDMLLFVASVILAVIIGVTYVRVYHQNMISREVGELSDLLDDQARFDGVVDELTKRKFRLLARWSIAMTWHPRFVLILGVLIFGLLWIAAVF